MNFSFARTTWARSGSPDPGTSGTRAGTDPPTSTSMDCPRSMAQTQTGGGHGLAPGHHSGGTTPTRLADNVRSVTAEATCAVLPAIAPALAPAMVAACAAYASADQTAA